MKKIVILGSGAGGTIVGVKLRKELSDKEWKITIIDNDEMHHYQPGWLFIPFGIYGAGDCMKPKREFIPKNIDFVLDEIVGVNPDSRQVEGKKGKYDYDWLVIATGCRPCIRCRNACGPPATSSGGRAPTISTVAAPTGSTPAVISGPPTGWGAS